MGLMTYPNRLT